MPIYWQAYDYDKKQQILFEWIKRGGWTYLLTEKHFIQVSHIHCIKKVMYVFMWVQFIWLYQAYMDRLLQIVIGFELHILFQYYFLFFYVYLPVSLPAITVCTYIDWKSNFKRTYWFNYRLMNENLISLSTNNSYNRSIKVFKIFLVGNFFVVVSECLLYFIAKNCIGTKRF